MESVTFFSTWLRVNANNNITIKNEFTNITERTLKTIIIICGIFISASLVIALLLHLWWRNVTCGVGNTLICLGIYYIILRINMHETNIIYQTKQDDIVIFIMHHVIHILLIDIGTIGTHFTITTTSDSPLKDVSHHHLLQVWWGLLHPDWKGSDGITCQSDCMQPIWNGLKWRLLIRIVFLRGFGEGTLMMV